MAIHFIPNDPEAGEAAPPMRVQRAHRGRPAGRAGFTWAKGIRQARHEPGTPEFVFWQCREAALLALDAWESIAGSLTRWQGDRARIALRHDAGVDLNAYYDRASVAFFHRAVDGRTIYSGASTDVVAHEVGHALLDAIRPDLWDAAFLETGAFHEAFGDCVATLTALEDVETRRALLEATKSLRKRNFVESTAESLAHAIRRLRPSHNAAEPRHAFNAFRYQVPETLPNQGGPGALLNEVHSFGMLFSGCFYDLVAGLFAAGTRNEAGLLASARTAGRLLVRGAAGAMVTPRFLHAVGRAMVLAEVDGSAGDHRRHVRRAFARHGIELPADDRPAPTTVLAGRAAGARTVTLGPDTRRDLARRLGVPATAGWSVEAVEVSGRRFTQAVHTRRVRLDAVDRRLRGVTIAAQVPILLGDSGGRAAVMGDLPDPISTEREVRAFVASLVEHGQIEFPPRTGPAKASRRAAEPQNGRRHGTHRVVGSGRAKRLVRIRFECHC